MLFDCSGFSLIGKSRYSAIFPGDIPVAVDKETLAYTSLAIVSEDKILGNRPVEVAVESITFFVTTNKQGAATLL
jgi:hypothetical protein